MPERPRGWLRRWPWVAAGFLAAALLSALLWLPNWQPLGVDETPISVGPHDRVIETLAPDPLAARSLPECRLSLGREEVFSYLFWLHNDGSVARYRDACRPGGGDHRTGCIQNRVSVVVWGVPISYEMLGFIHHDTSIVMPMVVTLVGSTDGPSCA